ncbi:NFACT family protein [Gemella sp. GH3]|uniref:Rqc2 family fibronectin-binding protein n=1 Tax=unclassified Gemella TaxID=2624949 RepID=UPI0015D07490|nr:MULTISPECIES: NFACT RNA binding domain-containing protein [unclassified Gemella]MBF0713507.1 NFACT family protein [Gemella sp. GH3.1]NYS50459.1 NFACT family protein [Gemella sp. GH3]
MAFDGFFTRKIITELNNELSYGRINKINNISNNEIIFTIRKNTKKKLLISINPQKSRIHLTNNKYENPKYPSNFCTVLRKYLTNGYIINFSQTNNDRIIFMKIKNNDELGYEHIYYLIVELMGRHSNIIITDNNYKIIEAIKNSYDIEYSRSTVANIEYRLPPTQKKLDPFNIENYKDLYYDKNDDKFLLNNFSGVSSNLNNYFSQKKYNLYKFQDFCENFEDYYKPTCITENKKDFYFFDIYDSNYEKETFDNLSQLLDYYYNITNFENETNKNSNKKIYTFVKNKIFKLEKKIIILTNEITKAENNNTNELKGNLILANNYLYKNYVPNEITVQNFYNEDLENITIKLDSTLSIEKNAELYFNKHKKNKRTVDNLTTQIEISKQELVYFQNINVQLNNADISDIEEIIEELTNYGYIKEKVNKKNKQTKYSILNIDGSDIYIGKNNIQNNAITNKLAKRNYFWFHAEDIPGSHVVIFSDNPSKNQIETASILAGYFSKNKNEKYVNVDYTQIKHVKKIPGAKPGMVSYTNQTTIKVEIDNYKVQRLLQQIKK